ncbi:MAG: chemotaxis protein CheW [Mariprofundaceae bacterium]|nr:chemotaxis protein CheW [Mariprofundaceae bacterium]
MKQLCSFYIADELFALDLEHVLRVVPATSFTSVPLASEVVAGLFNWRNQIVLMLNIHSALGLPNPNDSADNLLLLIESPRGLLGIIVDAVDDVVNVSEHSAQTLAALPSLVACAYPVNQRFLMLLDYQQLVQLVE